VTEQITGVDIVRSQLLLAQGASIDTLGLPTSSAAINPPPCTAIQLRVTAEDATKGFTLSMGRVTSFQPPPGVGVRSDTHLSCIKPTTVGPSFDSLLAKIIVTGPSVEAAARKGIRALSDTVIKGVQTNIEALTGILSHPDFKARACSTNWLETNLEDVLTIGRKAATQGTLTARISYLTSTTSDESSAAGAASLGNAVLLFRKGDTFKLQLRDLSKASTTNPNSAGPAEEHLLRLDRVTTNNFPAQLMADVTFRSYSNEAKYAMDMTATTQTSVASSRHRTADPTNPSHVGLPFPGQFMEIYIESGDIVTKGELLCVVRQMKMELEVRAPASGTVKWVCEAEEGEQVNEGLLICEIEREDAAAQKAKL
jgi:pyruvate carboxylase